MGLRKAGPFSYLNDKISLFLQPDRNAVFQAQCFF